ncbi:MAG: ATP-binding cassette domain-containing protein [candidate division Zixibacteria bacterium]|nr:ATP-binding cassette domain-containing protein [candidate division Zixibacteria bacterium]
MNNVIAARGLHKYYRSGDQTLKILLGLDLEVAGGETVAVAGESGAGKTTLLNLLGGLDKPTDGRVFVDGTDIFALKDTARARFRNRRVAYVFQFHHLLPEFTALENVVIPLLIGRMGPREAEGRARKYLEAVGVSRRESHRPAKLSGGERQRVAVARALAPEPAVILADEPSGNLDERTAESLHDLLFDLNAALGQTFIIVTHNRALAGRCGRTLLLEGGVLHPVEIR